MNSTRTLFTSALLALAGSAPLAAAAQEARTSQWANLRAGPQQDYPLVARLGPGTPLLVQGCTSGYGWCDVIAPDDLRGWVYAGNLVYPYQNAQVPVIGYGALIGLPIVTFFIGNYWGDHYRHRPWYGNRGRWEDRPPPRPPAFRPPPPPRPGIRPPPGEFRPPPGVRPLPGMRPPPDVRPPGSGGGRPPGFRPPGENRPPPGARPSPTPRPTPNVRPPGERPGGGGGRPPGGQHGGGHGGGRPDRGGPGPQAR